MGKVTLSAAHKAAMGQGAHCHRCPLALAGSRVLPSSLPEGKVRLAIVGEGPSRSDENYGYAFSGLAGRILDSALTAAGSSRAECWTTHVALCRGESDKDNEKAAECCAPRFLRQAKDVDAPMLLMGKAPAAAVLGVRSILNARGFIWTAREIAYKDVKTAFKAASKAAESRKAGATLKAEALAGRRELAGRRAVPTLSMGFVQRADTWGVVFRIDVARAVRLSRGECDGPLASEGAHTVGGLSELKGMGSVVSLDIETDGIDARSCGLLCVGISDESRTHVVWPWRPAYAAGLAKWLASREAVVSHNGFQFDLIVLRNHEVSW